MYKYDYVTGYPRVSKLRQECGHCVACYSAIYVGMVGKLVYIGRLIPPSVRGESAHCCPALALHCTGCWSLSLPAGAHILPENTDWELSSASGSPEVFLKNYKVHPPVIVSLWSL